MFKDECHSLAERVEYLLVCLMGQSKDDVACYLERLWKARKRSVTYLIGVAEVVEKVCEYPHRPGTLRMALVESGLLEERDGEYFVDFTFEIVVDCLRRRLAEEHKNGR